MLTNKELFHEKFGGSVSKRVQNLQYVFNIYFIILLIFNFRQHPHDDIGWGGADTHLAFAMLTGYDFELFVTAANGKDIIYFILTYIICI